MKVQCENGFCHPVTSKGYTDSCQEICGESSCKDAILPVDCDLRKNKKFASDPLNGYKLLCFNGELSHLKCFTFIDLNAG